MKSFSTFATRHGSKIFSIFLLIVSFFSYMKIFAIGSPYQPGQTFDPACIPSEVNCVVQIIPDQAGNNGKYLTTNGSVTSWGTIVTPVFTIGNGNGTTASGSIVNWGGPLTGNVYVTSSGYSINLNYNTNSSLTLSGGLAAIGDTNGITNANYIAVDDSSNYAYYDNRTHTGRFGINKAIPTEALDVVGNFKIDGSVILPSLASGATATSKYWKLASGESIMIFRDDPTYYTSGPITGLDLFIGRNAGNLTATGGGNNIGLGDGALSGLTSGFGNIALGLQSSLATTTGNYNIAIGNLSLANNTASGIVGVGYQTLRANTSGGFNTAIGNSALAGNTTGSYNTAVGADAQRNTTTSPTGSHNVSVGGATLRYMTSASQNAAFGYHAGHSTSSGSNNSYLGYSAGWYNTTGSNNIFVGSTSGMYNATASNQIFINSLDRINYSGDQNESPLYIQQNATVGSQLITLNGNVGVRNINPGQLLTLGTAGTTTGTLGLAGSTSGTITIQPQAAAGTYNFNLPTAAGTAGQLLTSQGGVGTAMTWTTPYLTSLIPGSGTTVSSTGAGTYRIDLGGALLANALITGNQTYNFEVRNGSSNAFLRVNNATKIYGLGDLDNSSGGSDTSLILNDSTATATLLAPNNLKLYGGNFLIDTDSFLMTGGHDYTNGVMQYNYGTLTFGDLAGYGNNTRLTVDDQNENLSFTSNSYGDGLLQIYSSSGIVYLGDAAVDQNGTRIMLDDSTQTIGIGASNGVTISGRTSIVSASNTYSLEVGSNSVVGIVSRFTNSTGSCTINPTTSSVGCSSDQRLKKNITDLDNLVLDKILSLRPVTYNWNGELDSDSKHEGFIAQEMEQVFPNIVATDPTTGMKSIYYTNLIPYTIKAVQEMNIKIQGLSSLDTSNSNSLGSLVKGFLENVGNNINSVFFGEVHTKKLCIEDVCVTKDQLRELLENQATNGNSGGGGGNSTPTDICSNIDGNQSEVPVGYHADNGNMCTLDEPPSSENGNINEDGIGGGDQSQSESSGGESDGGTSQ